MEIKNLVSYNFWWEHIPDLNRIDYKEITKQLLEDEHKQFKFNHHYDINVSDNRIHIWIDDYVRDRFRKIDSRTLEFASKYGSHIKKDTNSITRNHLNKLDILNSPDFVGCMCLKGNATINFEYDNHREKSCIWSVPIEERKFVMWDSDMNYYIKADEDTLLITNTYTYRR